MLKKGFLAIILIVFFTSIFAQDKNSQYAYQIFVGKNEYRGDIGNGFFTLGKNIFLLEGIGINKYLSPDLDGILELTYGQYGLNTKYHHFLGNKLDGSLLVKCKFDNGSIFSEKSKFAPYFVTGIGIASYFGEDIGQGASFLIPVGVGVRVKFNEGIALQYQLLYNLNTDDKADGTTDRAGDNFIRHSIGFVFNLNQIHKSTYYKKRNR